MPTTVWTSIVLASTASFWDDGVTTWDGPYTWDPAGGIVWTEQTITPTSWSEVT